MTLHEGPRTTQHSPLRPPLQRSPWLALALLQLLASLPLPVRAGSPLLEKVKQNPQIARNLCGELRELNKQGTTSSSPRAVGLVAQRQGLNATDAEILTTYVVGLYCPDVR
jgi:hypothetical protein